MTSTAQMLDEIADALALLPLLATTKPPGQGGGGHSAPGSKPPLNLDPLAISQDVHRTLVGWVRICHEDWLCDGDDWPADNATAVTLWLRRHAEALAQHEAAAEFADEVRSLRGRCWAVMGEAPPRARQFPCRRCGEALQGVDADMRPARHPREWRWAACPMCGQTETLTDDLRKLGELPITLPQYAAEVGVPLRTLQHRVKQASIQSAGRSGRHPTYRREDLSQIAA